MRFRLIDAAKKEFPVQRLCKVLGVSQSGYFARKDRPACRRQHEDMVRPRRNNADVNAGARLHRFPEQRCINNADENALEHGLASWASGWGQIVFGRVCVVAG